MSGSSPTCTSSESIEAEARAGLVPSNIEAGQVLWAPNGRFLIFTTGHHRVESQVARVDLRPPLPEFREEEFAKLFEPEEPKSPTSTPEARRHGEEGGRRRGRGGEGSTEERSVRRRRQLQTPEPEPRSRRSRWRSSSRGCGTGCGS